MPKIVDHTERRRELGEAVWRVIDRDGVAEVSIRTVAAESGWSSGALRHYFATRAELLAFACELVITKVTERIEAGPRTDVSAILRETMPLDPERRTEVSIMFSFLALGLGDPALARVQRTHFTAMYDLCRHLVPTEDERAARRLHALVDGLSVQVLAGHLTPAEADTELVAYLDELYG
ncbi:TetR/AcrR family transcriptional regulator [Actinoplanes friuliensis]|uniref:Putative TetR-family transcriptional regulator n=1 Tax=Actinoplanes friuliensis DSM 7358 TaxID=1246995 RepID=U5W2I6_9ACTN|nr:TetR family transcriptional regulator C-terminal domain-containing protein [Actinoplanes friuliensis]AGZ42190.1 putative TetR-family transcriptional regulator [Actinoplanes friuliensis DSM 7358]